jgi:hypothetical protein
MRDDPRLQPVSIAVRNDHVLGAPPASGDGSGALSADISDVITTPLAWHKPDRPRVKARLAWLAARAKP